MTTIDLSISSDRRQRALQRVREREIVIPTLAQMKNPELIPAEIKARLHNVGLWELNPLNLFRITWKNEPLASGGDFGGVNYLELPKSLTGVEARIIVMVGKWFPTGAHKVGAAFGCLVPRLVTGQFDPTTQKAVWPSTGNFCRGGAYDSAVLGCQSIAILPEGMSRERFEWLSKIAGEVIATPGSESNVKEIYLAGKVDQLTVSLTGMGTFNSENMQAKRAIVTNECASAAIVRVSDSLNATMSGLGSIEYIGNPQVTKRISGPGAVRQRLPLSSPVIDEKVKFTVGTKEIDGILTHPAVPAPYPAIVLLQGAERASAQHPYYIAHAGNLVRLGFAVLRYDGTGWGGGNSNDAGFETLEYRTQEAIAAVKYLSSPELKMAMETWKEIKFEFDTLDKLDVAHK